MSATVTVKLTGFAELERRLHEIGPDLGRKALRSGVYAAAKVVRDEARARAPVESGPKSKHSGLLRRSIILKSIREKSNPNQQTYYVTVRHGKKYGKKNQNAYYWRFVEFDFAHKTEFGSRIVHARPYMRPAFEARKYDAVEAIRTRIEQRLAAFCRESR